MDIQCADTQCLVTSGGSGMCQCWPGFPLCDRGRRRPRCPGLPSSDSAVINIRHCTTNIQARLLCGMILSRPGINEAKGSKKHLQTPSFESSRNKCFEMLTSNVVMTTKVRPPDVERWREPRNVSTNDHLKLKL